MPVVALAGLFASPANAQTWSIVSLDTIGCGSGETNFTTNVSGASGSGPERFRTIVRTGSGDIYMNEDAGVPASNGNYAWSLYGSSSGGPVTNAFPLPGATPIYVDFQSISGVAGPVIFHREVTLSRCDGGTIIGDRPLVVPSTSTVAVPTLGTLGLALLALLVGMVPLVRGRARR